MGEQRPRTIVTADPELDDLNSMIRLLLYSNEILIDGLVYASSRFHWKGDGRGTRFFLPGREYSDPQTSWRWAEGERFIADVVDAYAQVHANLLVHDSRYPDPDELRSRIREGNVAFEGDMSEETPGSQLITEALLDDHPGPLHLQVWAGTSTVARALLSIEERYSGDADWQQLKNRVAAKAVITKFASQDETYEEYIRPRWPDIRVVDVATTAWGYFARRVVRPDDAYLLSASWIEENITSVGPLGRLYRTWGDGRRMVQDDPTDFFHLSGFSAEELRSQGYWVWIEPEAAGEWISEGDSTNMLNLIFPGLRGHEHPGYGGFGGRAVRTEDGPDTWSVAGAEDSSAQGETPPEYSVTRWFADAQHDFAARLQWSISPRHAMADHHPVVEVSPGLDLEVIPGEDVALSAEVRDPDGGELTYRWWQYREAGSHPGQVHLMGKNTSTVVVAVPDTVLPGETIHIIVEVQGGSRARMKTTLRIILAVREALSTHVIGAPAVALKAHPDMQ